MEVNRNRSTSFNSTTSVGSTDSKDSGFVVQEGHMDNKSVTQTKPSFLSRIFTSAFWAGLFGSGANKQSDTDPFTMHLKPTSKEILDGYAAKDQAYKDSKQQQVVLHPTESSPEPRDLSPSYKSALEGRTGVNNEPNAPQQKAAFDRFKEANSTLRENPKPVEFLSVNSNIGSRQHTRLKQVAHENALKEYKEALAGLDSVGLSYDSQTGEVSKKN